jgi:hypothetical protein
MTMRLLPCTLKINLDTSIAKIMSKIQIDNLQPAGIELLLGGESFLTELVNAQAHQIQGGGKKSKNKSKKSQQQLLAPAIYNYAYAYIPCPCPPPPCCNYIMKGSLAP